GRLRHRPGVVRGAARPVHRTGANLAADRHQPFRDPKHLEREAERSRPRHDPVPFDYAGAVDHVDDVAATLPLAAGAYVVTSAESPADQQRKEENAMLAWLRDLT